MLRIAVLGAGRMAREILQVIDASDQCVTSGVWARKAVTLPGISASVDLPSVRSAADVAIDFTLAAATSAVIQEAVAAGMPLVCGVSGFTTEIHETHHIHKLDSPSGTALLLAETVAASREQSFEDVYYYQADGSNKQEPTDAIKYFVSRKGEVPGDHCVVFQNASEQVQLVHSVTDRRVFAEGAVAAACWLPQQSVGQYCMADVLIP